MGIRPLARKALGSPYTESMDTRKAVLWGGLIGMSIGGYVPTLWGSSMFSFTAMLCSAAGAVLGFWLGYRLTN